jgi:cytochrome c
MKSLSLALTLLALAGPAAAAGDAAAGKMAFNRACRVCHQLAVGAPSTTGPNLAGVVGRRAGSDAGFTYSPALRAAAAKGLTWNPSTLDVFLAKPTAVVPGTSMPVATANAQTRLDLAAYLASVKP